jgi:crotonobetainyl-CoA:carnitine CoA-transferase CaiB-like acyl-CoA transferase
VKSQSDFLLDSRSLGALAGVRVIDMSRVVAGPLGAQILSDLGAEVIKVERLGGGDDLRSLGPPWVQGTDGCATDQSTYFQSVNRGKRSICVDFTKPRGADIVRALAAKADVLIENFRTGTLDQYGLGYLSLRTVYPRLIYCSVTGFGQTGPYADRSGYDYLAQAMGGQMAVTGRADGEPGEGPLRAGIPVADVAAGMNIAIGILAALFNRASSGVGQHVDISLLDSQIAMMLNPMAAWLNGRTELKRMGNDHPSAVPYGVFPSSDGFMLIATFNDREFVRLAEALGHEEWAGDGRFRRSQDRVKNRVALIDLMGHVLRVKPKAHWIEVLNAAKISCGPISSMSDIESDPQIAAREMVVSLPHALARQIRLVGSPLKLSGTPVTYRRAPPLVGEHTAEVLQGTLGVKEDEIERLRADCIVQ